MTRRRWIVLAACLGVLTVLFSGCSGGQPASETLPSTSQTSASNSAEALPPLGPVDFPMPAEARTKDAAGAEAFLRYYFDLLNKSLADMDVQYIREFAVKCEDCDRIASETEADAKKGYRYRGGELTITDKISIAVTSVDQAESAFVTKQAALTVVDGSGNPVSGLSFDAQPRLSSGALSIWDQGTSSWKMKVLTLG